VNPRKQLIGLLAAVMTLLLPAAAFGELPKTSREGLVLQDDTKFAAVYLLPGETLQQYQRVMLGDLQVAFKKGWQKTYNRNTTNLRDRISNSDIEKMKEEFAGAFDEIFSNALEQGGYEIAYTENEDVLLIKPAVVDLIVTAPDTSTTIGRTNVTREAGEMTLYMELYDSVTGAKLAVVADTKTAGNQMITSVANRVTNKEEFSKVMQFWADTLVKGLNEARAQGAD
jgi:hypothetical protein